jgi:hypothetical protein
MSRTSYLWALVALSAAVAESGGSRCWGMLAVNWRERRGIRAALLPAYREAGNGTEASPFLVLAMPKAARAPG